MSLWTSVMALLGVLSVGVGAMLAQQPDPETVRKQINDACALHFMFSTFRHLRGG